MSVNVLVCVCVHACLCVLEDSTRPRRHLRANFCRKASPLFFRQPLPVHTTSTPTLPTVHNVSTRPLRSLLSPSPRRLHTLSISSPLLLFSSLLRRLTPWSHPVSVSVCVSVCWCWCVYVHACVCRCLCVLLCVCVLVGVCWCVGTFSTLSFSPFPHPPHPLHTFSSTLPSTLLTSPLSSSSWPHTNV